MAIRREILQHTDTAVVVTAVQSFGLHIMIDTTVYYTENLVGSILYRTWCQRGCFFDAG